MKRAFDFCLTAAILTVGLLPLAMVALLVKLTSKGPVLYWAERIGRNNRIFRMPKFRTMRVNTPEVASHLLTDPDQWLTPIGNLLRRSSLDELPQLWSILKGDMSLVGPRPALHNQHDLIALRAWHGVHQLLPGLTGWAQINGRDESSIADKIRFDADYLQRQSFWFDLKTIFLTFFQVLYGKGADVPHELRGDSEGAVPAEAFLYSASVWIGLGEHERAIADCDRAVRLEPDNPLAFKSRGDCHAAKGEVQEALADYDVAIALDPNFKTAIRCRATLIDHPRNGNDRNLRKIA